jgi:hypothetical protein
MIDHRVRDTTKNYLVTIPIDAAIVVEELTQQPTLEQLRQGVGDGHIEIVPRFTKLFGRDCVAFCNENGKITRPPMPTNHLAHTLWQLAIGRAIRDDVLVGPICVVIGTPKFLRDL